MWPHIAAQLHKEAVFYYLQIPEHRDAIAEERVRVLVAVDLRPDLRGNQRFGLEVCLPHIGRGGECRLVVMQLGPR